MKLTKTKLKEIIREEIQNLKEGSLDWGKNFKWAKEDELRVISKLVFMNPKGIDGVIAMQKKEPLEFKKLIQKMAKKGLGE